MKSFLTAVLLAALLSFCAFPQITARIMTYNVLNYPGTSGPERNPYLRTVISSADPDIIVVGELNDTTGFKTFRDSVMKNISSDYEAGTFIDGPDSDHGIFFKASKFKHLYTGAIKTELRDISQFTICSKSTLDTLIIFAVHLKASSGIDNESKRAKEVDSLRKVTNKLHPGANFIVLGDFNIYKSTESAYLKLLDNSTPGYFVDLLKDSLSGTWNNAIYARFHTQSPRTRPFQGGSTGGMDDRFDMILMSQTVIDAGGISYTPGSYVAYGNDGNHYNDSINAPPNTAVGQVIANAIHYSADHIPVFADFSFDTPLPVELTSFTGVRTKTGVRLNWETATEVNNYGFEIERSTENGSWVKIAFVQGHNTSNSPKYYQFLDNNAGDTKLFYRLKQIDNDGTFEYSNTIEIAGSLPKGIKLLQNYPNPFNPSTKISYELPDGGYTSLRIFDVLGNEIATLVDSQQPAGSYEVEFRPTGLAAGIYLYRLTRNGFDLTNKMFYLP
ncbi:MAG: T9SS type A sorting domain-containing protein [Ignavibacteriales bacterium]|nr:MAG: T9SS type A sorting domain-containing protein [Ignavibacteriaceae bacterium]MBW7873263.1 T9SS type A sorting domain-containing protein [Ignavibacteria bacterium]MCZ2143001.1 T9SS type A sorting domain-containing protein [Ignavibacteriales bacterium]MBV6444690.1 hypothetical protein [Ignavibacteriaceae bacterium]MBZ0196583.1 T9SS type A sorting domain-containing protein [Ignavibacteriaceae bacterium]